MDTQSDQSDNNLSPVETLPWPEGMVYAYEPDLPNFRTLYENLMDCDGPTAYRDVMLPWHDQAQILMHQLQPYAEKIDSLLPKEKHYRHIWSWYALSRVDGLLLLQAQPGDKDGTSWRGPGVTLDERAEWFTSLGMTLSNESRYHPFYHEIVTVEQAADPDEPISLLETLWPGLMFGKMLFARAGVRVRGGRNFIKAEIAANTTLYWAHRRKNRPYQDLSHGWGSNSQWRTDFRRDYADDDYFYYNVDGDRKPGQPPNHGPVEPDDFDPVWQIEVVTNRCLITLTRADEGDLFPYNFQYHEPRLK